MLIILHQEPDFLIVDKPSGLMTHPLPNFSEKNLGGQANNEDTVSTLLLAQFPELQGVGGDPMRPGIVHRLDKETSGLLVIARTQTMYDHLRKQFDEGKVEKEYVALVYGAVRLDHGIIDTPLSRSSKGQFTASDEGREALTEYTVTQRFKNLTLVKLHPKTGRTHQLRVHLKSIGHPIVGDPLYRAKIKARIDFLRLRQGFGGQARLFLHAGRIKFTDFAGAMREFEAPLPEELQRFLATLKIPNHKH